MYKALRIAALAAACLTTAAEAATFTVTNSNDTGAGSLRNAIQAANATPGADSIVLDSSLAGATLTLATGALFVTDALTITGLDDLDFAQVDAADTLTIDANNASQVFVVSAPTGISHLAIVNGLAAADGGCIVNSSQLTIGDSSIANCDATGFSGGAIFNAAQGKLTLHRSIIENGTAEDGGLIYSLGTLSLADTRLLGGVANDDGGGIYSDKSLFMRRSSVSGNDADDSGGGIYARGIVDIARSTVSGNEVINANASGGGIFIELNATVLLYESTIGYNLAPVTGVASGLRLQAPSEFEVGRSVISANDGAPDCQLGGVVPDVESVSLADDASCTLFQQATTGEIALAALAANSNLANPTLTHALGMGSVALDRIPCRRGVDQRHVGRLDGLCDIGAFEDQDITVAPACTMAPAMGCTPFTQGKLKIAEGLLDDTTDRFSVKTRGATPNVDDFGNPNDPDNADAQSLCVYSGGALLNEYNVDAGGADPNSGRLLWKVGKDAKSANYSNPATNLDGVRRVRLRGGPRGRFDLDARGAIIEKQQDLPVLADFPLTIQHVSSNGFCAEIVFDEPELRGNKIQAKEKP